MERWTRKKNPKSSQFVIQALIKLGSTIDAYASVCEFLCNCEFQTLNIISMSMGIAPTYIHACWCSSATSSHSRMTLPYLMSSWHRHTILLPHLIVVAQWRRWSPLMMMKDLFKKFSWNPDGVRKFTICSIYVRFWSHSTCYSPIMNTNHFIFIFFNEKCDVPSHLHNYSITCKGGHKGCGSNLNTITS